MWSYMSCLQSGEKVTTLDELQDIDELHVEEVNSLLFFPAVSLLQQGLGMSDSHCCRPLHRPQTLFL